MSGKISFSQAPTANPADCFAVVNFGAFQVNDDYKLTISGDVENPKEYTLADLQAMDQVTMTLTKPCMINIPGGNLIFNAEWTGVDLAPILESVGVKEGVNNVVALGYDGWSFAFPLTQLIESKAFLALKLGGKDLEIPRGAPVMLAVPGGGGAAWVKFLKSLEFTTVPEDKVPAPGGVLTPVNSGFLVPPNDGMEVSSPVHIEGYAFAHLLQPITKIMLSGNYGKTWDEFTIPPDKDPGQWVYWKIDWTPPGPGHYLIKVKAVSGDVVQDKEANLNVIVK